MAIFTTWADLKVKMLNDLASGDWRVSEYEISGRKMKYRSFNEFKGVLEYVKYQAGVESGAVVGRTYAANGRLSE